MKLLWTPFCFAPRKDAAMSPTRSMLRWSFGLIVVSVSLVGTATANEIIYQGEYPATSDVQGESYGDMAYISDTNSCASDCGESSCGSGDCDGGCGSDCGSGCGGCRKRQCASQQESWYNCGCNGSYKFPVPPLYTYMWPGLYSQQLVTDYHSPWRFPPLKPYTNEAPTGEPFETASSRDTMIHQVSAQARTSSKSAAAPTAGKRLETTSERIRRLYDAR